MGLISRENVLTILQNSVYVIDAERKIRMLPYEISPNRPPGHWEWKKVRDEMHPCCSECGCDAIYEDNFCPNCGADMRGDK